MIVNYNKNGLVPAIVQDAQTKTVLMLGYMNKEALEITQKASVLRFLVEVKTVFGQKGRRVGNFLNLKSLKIDCDGDTLLIKASPEGPTCHKGTDTCWEEENAQDFGFLSDLEQVISNRKHTPNDASYVSSLFEKGINKIAQKGRGRGRRNGYRSQRSK